MTFLSHFPALISVHDIMPETLPRLKEMVGFFDRLNIKNIYLLIVPGRQWEPGAISYIRSLGQRGYHLVGHGWQHECLGKKRGFHRIHASFFSRNAAEHLSFKSCEDLKKLICRCYFWFEKSGLPPPSCYIPPAWAMGQLTVNDLERLPFRWYEYLTGIFDSYTRRFYRLPLMGFEADTFWREGFLTLSNLLHRYFAMRHLMPCRIAIHPFDFDMKLKSQLESLLESSPFPITHEYLSYGAGQQAPFEMNNQL